MLDAADAGADAAAAGSGKTPFFGKTFTALFQAEWIAAINACGMPIGGTGTEPRYRCGLEITADSDEQYYFDLTYHFLKYERKKG